MLVTPYLNQSPPKSPPKSPSKSPPKSSPDPTNLLLNPSGGDLGGDGRRKVTLV